MEGAATGKRRIDAWRAWLVGELFLKASERFAPGLTYVLENCDEESCYQLSRCLQRAATFPSPVVDAVQRRLLGSQNAHGSPSFLFGMLARMDWSRLVSDSLSTARGRWTIEAKVAYVRALGGVASEDSAFAGRRLSILDALASDGAVMVRRSASLAILKCAPETLVGLWRVRARSEEMQMRVRAAEMVECVPQEVWSGDEDADLLRLRQDRFRIVRATVSEACQQAERRSRAERYVDRVKAVTESSDDEIFKVFPYGEALVKIGDGDTIEALRMHLREREPPLNVDGWICRIIKGIEKAREGDKREVTRGWDAILEHFDGILTSNGVSFDAAFHLWRIPGDAPSRVGQWGGTVVLDSKVSASDLFRIFEADYVTVGGWARGVANAIVTKTRHDAVLILKGSGRYPSSVET